MIAYVVIAVVLLAVGFGSGWQVNGWRHDAEEKSRIEAQEAANREAQARMDKAAERVEKSVANIRVVQRTFYNEVKNETTNTVYSDPNCNLPESGRLLRNRAIEAANRAGEPPGGMPADPGKRQADVLGGPVRR